MKENEEHHEWTTFQSWLFIIILPAFLYTLMMILMMIPDTAREWDFGTVSFTPSESVYSTSIPGKKKLNNMIEPLPEGIPMKDQNK